MTVRRQDHPHHLGGEAVVLDQQDVQGAQARGRGAAAGGDA